MTNSANGSYDIDVLAGEFVLGVMDDGERREFEARIATDPTVRAAVAAARMRFLELDLAAPEAPVSPSLWDRIVQTIDSGEDNVVGLKEARARRKPAEVSALSRQSRSSFWKGFAAAGVAACLIAVAAWQFMAPMQPKLIVVLLDSKAQPVSIVEALDNQRIRILPLGPIDIPSGKTLEVWTLPDKDTGPVSMGLLNRLGDVVLKGPALPEPKADQLYEITIEPEGGSPTGKPTGPIVGKGFARVPHI
ncbi:conserved protein of unknown function [Candidatus Filomicrobium marinum]|uniref:Regulator of SigK n=1 Tax=Candidatus Filomicrobium marinum TaxID=1608628 RepID=A0A0D6JDD7_9HYPH|nr:MULTISPECIES: anti-sigma factor [Filomicrobium]MCV0368080.1 anti-sigma factor [Filomicrobium sp.]CFX15035.1 conserved protein of unknown function [Candidatus Filomicrobium marinum]CPR17894.1 conserved protein of unknown function [Candidatus Filomicrobium marinum]